MRDMYLNCEIKMSLVGSMQGLYLKSRLPVLGYRLIFDLPVLVDEDSHRESGRDTRRLVKWYECEFWYSYYSTGDNASTH